MTSTELPLGRVQAKSTTTQPRSAEARTETAFSSRSTSPKPLGSTTRDGEDLTSSSLGSWTGIPPPWVFGRGTIMCIQQGGVMTELFSVKSCSLMLPAPPQPQLDPQQWTSGRREVATLMCLISGSEITTSAACFSLPVALMTPRGSGERSSAQRNHEIQHEPTARLTPSISSGGD